MTFFNLRNPKSKTSLNDIIIECNFNDDVCNGSDFDMIVDKQGFISYRFNTKKAFTAGKINGLKLLLYYGDETDNNFEVTSRFDGYQIGN